MKANNIKKYYNTKYAQKLGAGFVEPWQRAYNARCTDIRTGKPNY